MLTPGEQTAWNVAVESAKAFTDKLYSTQWVRASTLLSVEADLIALRQQVGAQVTRIVELEREVASVRWQLRNTEATPAVYYAEHVKLTAAFEVAQEALWKYANEDNWLCAFDHLGQPMFRFATHSGGEKYDVANEALVAVADILVGKGEKAE